ncbi:MAG: T9SS type A sorting domain-containing protein, partial [Flavobacteriales bacterium]|nr:T9SS type A sorting domain-containing protein [Flavobacteriales bacterium]
GTTINPGTRDTLVLSTGWTPSVPGMVEVQITVQSDSTDANPGDNVATKTFDVTGPMMADEYNIMSNNDPGLTGSITIAQNATYSLIGTEFQIENSGSMAYGVGLVFRDNTELPAVVNVYLSDDNADVGEILAFEIQGWHLSGAGENNVINIPFDGGPVALDPTMDYTLLVEGPGTEQVRIGVGGTTNPGGLFGYDNGDATLYQFIGWGNPAVMTSLMLAEAPSSIEETNNGLTIMGNRPNPFNDVTTIVYELVEGRNVGFQVFDVTGKVVFEQNLGNRAAGQHQIQLDAERFAPGMYNYTITAGDARISRNMVVTR